MVDANMFEKYDIPEEPRPPEQPNKTHGCKGCGFKRTWRAYDGISHLFPNVMQPPLFLRFLFWFSQRIPMEQLRTYTGLKDKSASAACSVLRHILTNHVLDVFAGVKFGDRPNTALCINETWFTQKKRDISGFCGR